MLINSYYKVAGDKQIENLKPRSSNIGGRIVKNCRIAGSGVYMYHRSEAGLFGLDVSKLPGDQQMFGIYRPPEVLIKNKEMFARVPVITGSHVVVNERNAKNLTVGLVGDTVDYEVDPKDGETYLYTTATIIAGDGIDAYERYGQLSVGYIPICEWKKGQHNGQDYDAELVGIKDVNHLLLCKEARGGPQCMVMDAIDNLSPLEKMIYKQYGGNKMSVFSRIFGSKKPIIAGDARVPVLLDSIAVGADPKVQVDAIRPLLSEKVAGDETFKTYLGELELCKDESPEVKAKAVEIVKEYYAELSGDAAAGAPDNDKGIEKESKDKSSGKDDKTAPGDKDPEEKKEPGDEKKDDEKGAGDSKEILSALNKIAERLDKLVPGDAVVKPQESTKEVKENPEAIAKMNMLIGGDASASAKASTDAFLKSILGGK